MYGLVNKAIEDLITREYGEAVWSQITESAGVTDVGFVRMESYDDAITYQLVGAAAEVLETPAADLLEAFGHYWIRYTAREGYGDLLDMSGESFVDFLQNLDNLHSRVGLSFPGLKPPSFRCEQTGDSSFRLTYRSGREGLSPMVRGLVRGLAEKFGIEVAIQQVQHRTDAEPIDVFDIEVLVAV